MRLKELMGSMTQMELAKKTKISQRTISNYLNGITHPEENLIVLANYFNVSLDYLCENDDSTIKHQEAYNLINELDEIYLEMSVAYMKRMLEDQQKIKELKSKNIKWTT